MDELLPAQAYADMGDAVRLDSVPRLAEKDQVSGFQFVEGNFDAALRLLRGVAGQQDAVEEIGHPHQSAAVHTLD